MSITQIKQTIEQEFIDNWYDSQVFFKNADIPKSEDHLILVHINGQPPDVCLNNDFQTNAIIRVFAYGKNDIEAIRWGELVTSFLQFKRFGSVVVDSGIPQNGSVNIGGLNEFVVDFKCYFDAPFVPPALFTLTDDIGDVLTDDLGLILLG